MLLLSRRISLIIALCVVLFAGSCAKVGPTGAVGPSGPAYLGSISGHVSLYDQYGGEVLINRDSVSLFMNSTTTTVAADSVIRPDNNGYYIYNYVGTGVYNITATATGYAATLIDNFQFLDGNLNKDIKLSAIPTFSVAVTTFGPGAQGDSILISCSPDPQPRNCIIFVNNTVSVSNMPAGYLLAYVRTIPAYATNIGMVINKQELYNTGLLASGSTVYLGVYSYVISDHSIYEDLSTGKNVYNAVSNLQIDSAIVP